MNPNTAPASGCPILVTGERGSLVVPGHVDSLDAFRAWVLDEAFPECVRVDFVDGRVEVDLTRTPMQGHGLPMTELIRVLATRVHDDDVGELFSTDARVTLPAAEASCQPDIVLVTHAAFQSGRMGTTPSEDGEDAIELVGPPDLVVEIVSPGSVDRDRTRLFQAYERGGVGEYWLVDGRGEELEFHLFRRDDHAFAEASADADGFVASPLLRRRYRFDRVRNRLDRWQYTLDERE